MAGNATQAASRRGSTENCPALRRICPASNESRARPDPQERDVALLAELADLVSQAGDLAARGPLMDHAALRGPHELGLGGLEGRLRLRLVAARDRVFDQTEVAPHARTARLVDLGATRNLSGRLLCGLGIGHPGSAAMRRASSRQRAVR